MKTLNLVKILVLCVVTTSNIAFAQEELSINELNLKLIEEIQERIKVLDEKLLRIPDHYKRYGTYGSLSAARAKEMANLIEIIKMLKPNSQLPDSENTIKMRSR